MEHLNECAIRNPKIFRILTALKALMIVVGIGGCDLVKSVIEGQTGKDPAPLVDGGVDAGIDAGKDASLSPDEIRKLNKKRKRALKGYIKKRTGMLETEGGNCTAFFISPSTAVTAKHCFEDGDTISQIIVEYKDVCDKKKCENAAVTLSPVKDIAVIQFTDSIIDVEQAIVVPFHLIGGSEVIKCGFPKGGFFECDEGVLKVVDNSMLRYEFSFPFIRERREGASGGPIVNMSGYVVGVHVSSYRNDRTKTVGEILYKGRIVKLMNQALRKLKKGRRGDVIIKPHLDLHDPCAYKKVIRKREFPLVTCPSDTKKRKRQRGPRRKSGRR